jgi:2,4'-dihydroxyacetophenone dioxygenase
MAAIPEDALDLRSLVGLTRQEYVVPSDDMPWIPYPSAEGVFVKPLRLNRRTGVWANLTKVTGGGMVNRHYHVGPVTGFVLEGSWYYAERDWVARAGTIIREPPGDIHTLIAGDEGTVTLFILEGALLYIDEQDNVVGHDDVLSHMRMYHEFCRQERIEPLDLDF